MIVLEIHKPGADEIQIFTSDKKAVTLGRHSSNDIRIEDDAVSRFHAEIEWLDSHHYIRDLDSRNGLFVNKVPVLEHRLLEGDEVRIGPVRLTYHDQESRSPNDSNVTRVVCLFPAENAGTSASEPTAIQEASDMPLPGCLVETLAESVDEERVGLEPGQRALFGQAALAIEMANAIARTHDLDTLLQETLRLLARRIPFTRGVVLVYNEDTRTYKPRAIYHDTSADPDRTPVEAIPVSMTIVNRCLETHQGICCLDAMNDPRFSASESIFDLKMRSVLCIPLRGRQHDLGVLQVDSPNERGGIKTSDLAPAMLAGNLLADVLESRLAFEQRARRERRGDEVRVLAAAAHCMHALFLMTTDQIRLLREAATMGDEDVLLDATEQFAIGQQSLGQRIEGLYDYVRGRMQPFAVARIDLILSRLLDDLAPTFDEKNVATEFVPNPEPIEGYFDPAALEMLFLNLLANAYEAAVENERPMIHITTERTRDNKVCVRIRDNGPGIAGDTQARLFMPFFTTKGRGRAGLGLTYVRHIVAAHDGRIECESEPGLGTTFTVHFPLRDSPPCDPSKPKTPDSGTSSSAPWLLGN